VTIMPKTAPKSIEWLALDKLHFDTQNPRLPQRCREKDEQLVADYMVGEEGALEIMLSIGASGYFPGEPLLVIPYSGNAGEYVVVEGNRRLTALKLLRNPAQSGEKKESVKEAAESAQHKPDTVPCVVFPERNDVLSYLGYRHVTGIKQWDPLPKSRYLKQLVSSLSSGKPSETTYREVANRIGSRLDYVKKLLCGLTLYEKAEESRFFGIENTEDSISFSLVTTALGYSTIVGYLGLDSAGDINASNLKKDNLKDLFLWMFKKEEGVTRLRESRNLGKLAAVIHSSIALKEFRAGRSLEDCFFLSEGPDKMVNEAIRHAYKKMDLAKKHTSSETHLDSGVRDLLHSIKQYAIDIEKLTKPD